MIIRILNVGPMQTNCYILGCEETREGVIIDPGGDADHIIRTVDKDNLTIRYVLNTHCHFDHMLGNAEVVRSTGAPLALHPLELPILKMDGGAAMFGVPVIESPMPDVMLEDRQIINAGKIRIQVLHTPGHSPGSVTFYIEDAGAAFDGDVLFAMGIGRTDLPGGDMGILMRSIRDVLFAMPGKTIVYPGHGPKTTVEQEQRLNPWLKKS